MIHGNSSKTWSVESFYIDFESNALSPFNDCYKDNRFTFHKDQQNVEVSLGNLSCFWTDPTDEATTITFSFYEKKERYLSLSINPKLKIMNLQVVYLS